MSRNTQAAENRKWLEHALSRYKEPSQKTGSACSVCSGLALNDDILTLETFRRWVEKGRSLAYQYNAELYHGTGKRTAFDHYQQKSKTFKLYKEI